jgi:hypothetical protein
MGKITRLDLARAVAAGLELGNALGVEVEADHPRAQSAEGDSNRQPDISETDDGELATVRHDLPLMAPRCRSGLLTPRMALFAMDHSTRLLEQAPIELDQVTANTLTRELQLDQFAAGLAKLAS